MFEILLPKVSQCLSLTMAFLEKVFFISFKKCYGIHKFTANFVRSIFLFIINWSFPTETAVLELL